MKTMSAPQTSEPVPGGEDEDDGLTSKLAAIVGRLESEARQRVADRRETEERWIDDLRQYNGRYDQATEKRFKEDDTRSQVFVNLTRPKTNAVAAKLWDLLFPTADRNWGIQPTPVPEIAKDGQEKKKAMHALDQKYSDMEAQVEDMKAQMAAAQEKGVDPAQLEQMAMQIQQAEAQMQEMGDQADAFAQEIAQMEADRADAQRRAELMQDEIDDQLKECRYQAAARDMIEDACQIGTGVIMGPIRNQKSRRAWVKVKDEATGEEVHQLIYRDDTSPQAVWVDPWSYFPDMRSSRRDNGMGEYLRHLMNESALRRLAKNPGFRAEPIRELIRTKATEQEPQYLTQLRDISGDTSTTFSEEFHVWQYIGPMEHEDMQCIIEAMGMQEEFDGWEPDPLDEIHAVVWFCQGKILKFALHPMDSHDSIISVFNIEKDPTSPFGYGIPYLMRAEQRVYNSAWRMMMDNARVAAGPQILINKNAVKPQNGRWEYVPFKIWTATEAFTKENPPFQSFDTNMHQAEIAGIIQIARSQIDEVTATPAITQGEQGSGVTKTAQGMALLMNSAKVIDRRMVKNFDDDVTVPLITRFYDWNMQFSEREAIKGDFTIDARGSSVLLVRELQAQNLMTLALQFSQHPIYGSWLKHSNTLREIFRAHMLDPDEHLLSEDAHEDEMDKQAKMAADAAKNDPGAAMAEQKLKLEKDKIDAQISIANMEAQTRKMVANLNMRAAIYAAGARENMTMKQIEARLAAEEMKVESAERKFAAELAQTEQQLKALPDSTTGGGNF